MHVQTLIINLFLASYHMESQMLDKAFYEEEAKR